MRKDKKIKKSKYNMFQNSWFMIKIAWKSKEKKVIILGLVSVILAVLLNLINLYITPTILSTVERHASVSQLIFTILTFVIGIMLVSALSTYVNTNNLFGKVTIRLEIINLLNKKAATTSYPNLDDDKFKNLLTKSMGYTDNNSSSTEAIWETLTMILTNILGFIIYVSLLTTIQPILIIVILLTTTISYFIGNYVNSYGYNHREEESEYYRRIRYISDCAKDLTFAKDIRIFGLCDWIEELYNKAMESYKAFHKKAESVYIWSRIADLVLTFIRNAIAYVYLIGLVINNKLDVASFLLFFSTVNGFSEWVLGILNGFNTLYKQSLDISIVRECIEFNEPFKFNNGEHILPEKNKKYEIKLENVSFCYPGEDKDTLTNINLTLKPGEKLAVVGLNGAGKTTLIKLICGFLDPTEGRVLLNGKDIKDYNRMEYYTMFSAVFQDFSLLAGTIAINVAQKETDINMELVKECIEKAGLTKKIQSLPNGYETYLNREVYDNAILLSGGETQRLMLARALYKDAPFIILDEPTAALDPIAESDIYQKYNEMTNEKSSVYISHRLASTRFCDRIILIDNGKIMEEGTHQQLLNLNGKYTKLYKTQSKYYEKGDEDNGEEEKF